MLWLALSALQACTLEALQRWLSKQLQDQVLGDTAIFGCLVTVAAWRVQRFWKKILSLRRGVHKHRKRVKFARWNSWWREGRLSATITGKLNLRRWVVLSYSVCTHRCVTSGPLAWEPTVLKLSVGSAECSYHLRLGFPCNIARLRKKRPEEREGEISADSRQFVDLQCFSCWRSAVSYQFSFLMRNDIGVVIEHLEEATHWTGLGIRRWLSFFDSFASAMYLIAAWSLSPPFWQEPRIVWLQAKDLLRLQVAPKKQLCLLYFARSLGCAGKIEKGRRHLTVWPSWPVAGCQSVILLILFGYYPVISSLLLASFTISRPDAITWISHAYQKRTIHRFDAEPMQDIEEGGPPFRHELRIVVCFEGWSQLQPSWSSRCRVFDSRDM